MRRGMGMVTVAWEAFEKLNDECRRGLEARVRHGHGAWTGYSLIYPATTEPCS